MRKISKISLVAAVAVAGFSTANAQPLEEAIKNVDVSGSVVYRYDNADNSLASGVNPDRIDRNRYKIGLNLSSKVNDYVKFNSRFIVGGDNSTYSWATTGAQEGGGDAKADVSLSQAYFGFTAIPNTVVNIGKQGLTTPYTVAVDINGNEQAGTGILALSTFGPITAGAGYFNNTNLNASTELNIGLGLPNVALDGAADMYVATVQGDLDFVKLEAWYAGMQDTFNSYTFAATSNLDLAENAKIGLEARYVYLGWDNDAKGTVAGVMNGVVNTLTGTPGTLAANDIDKDNSMFRFAVDGKFSIVNARLAYTKTGKDGGVTALDQDAKNTSLGWNISSNAINDADYYQAALGADILDNLNFTVHYGKIKGMEDNVYKANELYGQLTYKMSKNLNTYLRYGQYERKIDGDKDIDQDIGRLQVAYTF